MSSNAIFLILIFFILLLNFKYNPSKLNFINNKKNLSMWFQNIYIENIRKSIANDNKISEKTIVGSNRGHTLSSTII